MLGEKYSKYAGIEYHGLAGVTQSCLDAIVRLIGSGEKIKHASILTCGQMHCILLKNLIGDRVAIKTGFSSGYPGEGPTGLAVALQLLRRHGVEIDEYEVSSEILEAIDFSALFDSQLRSLDKLRPVRPSKWYEYIYDVMGDDEDRNSHLNSNFPVTVSFGLLDSRLTDLALNFNENPDNAVMSAFRRLEDVVRKKAGLNGEGG